MLLRHKIFGKPVQSASSAVIAKSCQMRSFSKHLKAFATIDPQNLSSSDKGFNLVKGEWVPSKQYMDLVDPLKGGTMVKIPDTQVDEIQPFVESLQECPKTGLHNPFKNKERYLMLSEVNRRVVECMHDKEVFDFFVKSVQRVAPKSKAQTTAEIQVTLDFFENFCGDRVRFLAEAQRMPGDHGGQFNTSYRFPYGPVGVITPFNFPIEIPVLQMMGALYMGNKPLVKGDSRTSIVLEQWIRMLHHCGLPKEDMDFIHADGPVMEKILKQADAKMTLFTGSSKVGEHLVKSLKGKVRLEDGGYDWKILGPDVPSRQQEIDFVAYTCDQDAYAHTGQKCSAQSILFMHRNWRKSGLLEKIKAQAARRSLSDLTIGPILSWNNEQIKAHLDAILELDGATVLFGGAPLKNHTIPKCYGAWEPTAIFVPLKHFKTQKKRNLLTTELFGPF